MHRNTPRLVLPRVLAEHAEEAAFLWILRSAAVEAPHYSLTDLAKLDGRLEAHLEGLRVAGEAGWEVCRAELKWEEPGEVFVAAVLALESGDAGKWQDVLAATGAAGPEGERGPLSALAWLPYTQVRPALAGLLAAGDAATRSLGVRAAALHRVDPGRVMDELLASGEAIAVARAARAAGELGRVDLMPALRRVLAGAEAAREVRFWAAWALALRAGDAVAMEVLVAEAAAPDSAWRERAADLAARRAAADGRGAPAQFLASASAAGRGAVPDAKRRRLAIVAAGAAGDPASVPWLLDQMQDPAVARAAGEAFSAITGADLARLDLDGDAPPGLATGPTDDPDDEDVSMDADEGLDWPHPARVRAWWSAHAGEFAPGTRHLLGRAMEPGWLRQVLRDGRQRQRAAAALELAMREPGQPLFEVRAPAARQRSLLRA